MVDSCSVEVLIGRVDCLIIDGLARWKSVKFQVETTRGNIP
jgi:hypothetical protein